MDVFVTGATGVLGRATLPLLAAAGHRVRGLARSAANEAAIRALGGEPVRADLYDAASLASALAGAGAVLHLATKIPPAREMDRPGAWEENDRIRAAGTRALVEAALGAGVATFVFPGVTHVYPDGGDRWIDAATTPPDAPPGLESAVVAEGQVARFTAAGRRGIVLRMGGLYGPDAASTRELLDLARRGIVLVIGPDDAYQSALWADDAGAAVAAALGGAPAGVYDVVDDEPLPRAAVADLFREAAGRRWGIPPAAWRVQRPAGGAAALLARSHRVSNRRFRGATGWAPAVPSARIGLARLVADAPDRARS